MKPTLSFLLLDSSSSSSVAGVKRDHCDGENDNSDEQSCCLLEASSVSRSPSAASKRLRVSLNNNRPHLLTAPNNDDASSFVHNALLGNDDENDDAADDPSTAETTTWTGYWQSNTLYRMGQPTNTISQQQQHRPIRISLAESQDPDEIISLLSSLILTPAILNFYFEHNSPHESLPLDHCSAKDRQPQSIAAHYRILKVLYSVRHPQTAIYVDWILHRFPDHIHTQILGMNMLRQMKLWDSATTVALQCLFRHKDSWNLHLTGFAILAECAERSKESRAILCRQEHVSYILRDVLRRFDDEPRILCNASATLCWILHDENNNPRESILFNDDDIVPSTIIKPLVRRYRHDASIFGNLVCLLTVWEIDFDSLKETILDGMLYHMQTIKVQEACLRWLHCAFPRFDPDCLQMVLQSMQYHNESSTSSHLVAKACRLLAFWIPDHKHDLLQSAAIEAVLAALQKFRHDPNMVVAADLFLNGLSMAEQDDNNNDDGDGTFDNPFGGGPQVVDFIFQELGIHRENPDEVN